MGGDISEKHSEIQELILCVYSQKNHVGWRKSMAYRKTDVSD